MATPLRYALATLLVLPALLQAQPWPAKPITLISPFPAGGITDLLSRIVGEELAKALGQPVVVENRTGAGGAIAMVAVAKAAPDGYTLVMGGSAPTAIVPALNPNATYHPKDFEPIAYVAGLPLVLNVHPSLPVANVKELLAYARAQGDRLNCAHHGVGTGTHLACVQFARIAGSTMAHVPYKGAPQVNADLLANRVQVYFGTLPTQIQYVREGKLRALGMASAERAPGAPEIPTLAEQGLAGLELDSWNAVFGPANLPKAIVSRLNTEIVRILSTPEVRKRIEATGSVVRTGSPEFLRKLTLDEYERTRRLGAEANIRLD